MRKQTKGVVRLLAVLAVGVCALAGAATALADTIGTDFESYPTGTINGTDGWSSLGAAGMGCAAYDHAVEGQSTYGSFGAQSLRISNAVVSGCFGDQTFSKPLADEAGETGATNGGLSGGVRQPVFDASFDFASATGTYQEGAYVVASPDRGDGARMSWVQIADSPDGLEVRFSEYTNGDFVQTTVASGLSRAIPHRLRITMHFVDGPGNDVVNVFVDGNLVASGTSWEDYFRDWEGGTSRTVDSILFRTGGAASDARPALVGQGFLIDNLTLTSAASLDCAFTTSNSTMTLVDDCTTDHTILVPHGYTLDGDGHTITAVDPAGGHFLGAVVQNGGTNANVEDVTITASGLADICDSGADRLTGVRLQDASGTVSGVDAVGLNQNPAGGESGCQEGNAFEFRAGTAARNVTLTGSSAIDYQKTGVIAAGTVAATIVGNTVAGSGPSTMIARNGIQVSGGATAQIEGNSVSGNDYTPQSFVACGLLFFDAQGVKQKKNVLFANERDLCNFGRGGGQFDPQA